MEQMELLKLKTHLVDTRSRSGPGSLLEAQIALTKIPEGDVLEAISSEEETKFDMRLWAWRTGQDFLGVVPADGYDRIFVRRHKLAKPGPRDLREVLRDETVHRDRILSLLGSGPMTLPELAGVIGEPVYEVSLWIWGMQRYGLVRALPKGREDDYYRYEAVSKTTGGGTKEDMGPMGSPGNPRTRAVAALATRGPEDPARTPLLGVQGRVTSRLSRDKAPG